MKRTTSLLVLVSLLSIIAIAPPTASAVVALPLCVGTITSTGSRASCQIRCEFLDPDGTLVDVVAAGVTADYAVDARVGVTDCRGYEQSCDLLYVATYGPVAGACFFVVRGASTGWATCWAEEFVGAFVCVAENI